MNLLYQKGDNLLRIVDLKCSVSNFVQLCEKRLTVRRDTGGHVRNFFMGTPCNPLLSERVPVRSVCPPL